MNSNNSFYKLIDLLKILNLIGGLLKHDQRTHNHSLNKLHRKSREKKGVQNILSEEVQISLQL